MDNKPVWQIKFYGTRGSLPICEPEFQLFGGNTSCIYTDLLLNDRSKMMGIFDAGTGIRKLGQHILNGELPKTKYIFLAFSHFHWDHIQGFPFFAPAYDPHQQLAIFAPHKGLRVKSLKQIFERQMQKEYFPVQLNKMGADFRFFTTEEFKSYLEMADVVNFSYRAHNHPGGAYSYRIEAFGRTVVICTDIEHGMTIDQNTVRFCHGADLLIHEAQYTSEELITHRGWGHSSHQQAIEVAELAEVKKLVMTHHDPGHNDEFLLNMEHECQKKFANCVLAREGMEIFV